MPAPTFLERVKTKVLETAEKFEPAARAGLGSFDPRNIRETFNDPVVKEALFPKEELEFAGKIVESAVGVPDLIRLAKGEEPINIVDEFKDSIKRKQERQKNQRVLERELDRFRREERPELMAKFAGRFGFREAEQIVNQISANKLIEQGLIQDRKSSAATAFLGGLMSGATVGIYSDRRDEIVKLAERMQTPYSTGEKVAGFAGSITGGLVTYGGISRVVGRGLMANKTMLSMFSRHPRLFGMTVLNLGEEAVESVIRTNTNQRYTWQDFMMGMTLGASFESVFGSVAGVRRLMLDPVRRQVDDAVGVVARKTKLAPGEEGFRWDDVAKELENKEIRGIQMDEGKTPMTFGELFNQVSFTKESRLAFLSGGDDFRLPSGKGGEAHYVRGLDGQPVNTRGKTQSDIDDLVHGGTPPGQIASRTTRRISDVTGQTKTEFKRKRVMTLLKEKYNAEKKGFRKGFVTGKRSVKEVQKELLDYIDAVVPEGAKGSQKARIKSKLLRRVKNANSEKTLVNAKEQVNKVVMESNHRELVGRLVNLRKGKSRKALENLPVDSQQRIGELLEPYLTVEPSASRIARAQEIQSQIDSGTEGLRDIRETQILGKTPIKKLDMVTLQGLVEEIDGIIESGKTLQAIKKIESDADVTDVLRDLDEAVNAEGGWRDMWFNPDNRNEFIRKLWMGDMEFTTPDRFFDMLDGFENYNGKFYKTFKEPVDTATSAYMKTQRVIVEKVSKLNNELGLKRENYERIGQWGLWNRVDDGKFIGREKLAQVGITEPPELSAKELQMYNFMRGTYNELFPDLQKTLSELESKDIKGDKVDNYWPMQTDWDAPLDINGARIEQSQNIAVMVRTNVEAGFSIQAKGGRQNVQVNAMKTFMNHVDDVSYYINVQPVLAKLNRIAGKTDTAGTNFLREMIGFDAFRYTQRYLKAVANNGALASTTPGRDKLLRKLRRNTSIGVMGYNITSVMKQPLALFNGAGMVGAHRLARSIGNVMSSSKRNFILNSSEEIRSRAGGETAIFELTKDGVWQDKIPGLNKATELAFYPLQLLDSLSAMAVWDSAYSRALRKVGSHDRAVLEADRIVRLTQASPLPKDRAFFQNTDEAARFFTQFQTFVINDWNLIKHDVIRAGLVRGVDVQGTGRRAVVGRMRATTMAIFMLHASLFEDIISARGDLDRAMEGGLGGLMADKIPVINNILRTAQFRGTGNPTLDALRDVGTGLLSDSTAGRRRGVGGAAKLIGIPGAGQVFRGRRNTAPATNDAFDVSSVGF